jgi:hypothetical protein
LIPRTDRSRRKLLRYKRWSKLNCPLRGGFQMHHSRRRKFRFRRSEVFRRRSSPHNLAIHVAWHAHGAHERRSNSSGHMPLDERRTQARRFCEAMIAPPEASGSDARSPDTLSPSVTRLQTCKINDLYVTEGVTDENRSGYTSILVTDVTCNRRNSRRLHLND